MRQWGSSLNHNGMSFFLATVPSDTQLYHGTSSPDIVRGLEWLAFEPEHALVFARPRRNRPPPGHHFADYEQKCDRDPTTQSESHHVSYHGVQRPLGASLPPPDRANGYLHVYTPKHTLRLLYIDGLSAGKTENGTLDTQDMLLLNMSSPDSPMGGEYERARGLCNLTSTLWENKIDGILRMEAGFEIIMCDFEQHMQRTDLVTVREAEDHAGPRTVFGGWRYIQAVASRYHGIGGQRAHIDFEDFVSVFAYSGLGGLFTNDVQSDYAMPRLQNIKHTDLEAIKNDVTNMVLRKDWEETKLSRDWQTVADVIVQRYAKPLHLMLTNETMRKDKNALATHLDALLRPFVSSDDRDTTLEIQRCVSQLIPALPLPPRPAACLAHRALHNVTSHICGVLFNASSIASSRGIPFFSQSSASDAVGLIDKLVKYLNWTTWKECGTCRDDEVCYIPMWPMGSYEDHAHPRCTSERDASNRQGYWGYPRRGPHNQRKGTGNERHLSPGNL